LQAASRVETYLEERLLTLKLRQRDFLLLVGILAGWIFWQPQLAYGQKNNGLVITQVGLSQVQGTTYLTMILSRADQPKIQPVADRQAPQLFIDFPKARLSNVPITQAGDRQLVKQVRTVALPGGDGVRIILDLMPGRPYSFWRSSRNMAKGGYQYMVGIMPDSQGSAGYTPGLTVDRRAASVAPETAEAPAPSRTYASERESTPSSSEEGESSRTYGAGSEYGRPTSGELGEIARLMPTAGPALGFLEQKGWRVQKDSAGRSGSPGSQKFLLASSQSPNLSITAEHIPTRATGSPGINVIALSTDKLADSDADKYRQMMRWDMAAIKSHYEDIGDYYDDGLKPLRIRLRERSKAIVLRDYEFIKQFLEAAVPQKPELPAKIMKHAQDKVNKRLEGAQYTESDNPLVIMDMVDFYTLKVYFIGR
jgi:hypothetical protein